jgi:hypothetical protein
MHAVFLRLQAGQDADGRYRAKRASVAVASVCGWPPHTAGIKAGHVWQPTSATSASLEHLFVQQLEVNCRQHTTLKYRIQRSVTSLIMHKQARKLSRIMIATPLQTLIWRMHYNKGHHHNSTNTAQECYYRNPNRPRTTYKPSGPARQPPRTSGDAPVAQL